MAEHYIRLDSNNFIIKAFSTDFEQPENDDICVNEDGGRHFSTLGIINPTLVNDDGAYKYKYDNGVVECSDEEIQAQIGEQPQLIQLSDTDIAMALAELRIELESLKNG